MKTINATVHVKPGDEDKFVSAGKVLVDATRREPGNTKFELYHDARCVSDFVFVEQYQDQVAIIAHRDSDHFQSFLRTLKDISNAPMDVMIFDGLGEKD